MLSTPVRKSITDLTRRKARASFTVLTLALAVASIGVFGVPAVMEQAMDRDLLQLTSGLSPVIRVR